MGTYAFQFILNNKRDKTTTLMVIMATLLLIIDIYIFVYNIRIACLPVHTSMFTNFIIFQHIANNT